jgi:hypothetical protein
MDPFEMVVAIVLIVTIGSIIKSRSERRQHRTHNASELEALRQRIETLEGEMRRRVEALETIVTSEGYDLKREFSRLERS